MGIIEIVHDTFPTLHPVDDGRLVLSYLRYLKLTDYSGLGYFVEKPNTRRSGYEAWYKLGTIMIENEVPFDEVLFWKSEFIKFLSIGDYKNAIWAENHSMLRGRMNK